MSEECELDNGCGHEHQERHDQHELHDCAPAVSGSLLPHGPAIEPIARFRTEVN